MPNSRTNYEQLIAYAAGALKGAEASRVEAYLREHPKAAKTVEAYKLAQASFAAAPSFEPSEDAVRRARACFKLAAPTARMSWLEAMDQFIARLIFDSRLQPAGVRSAMETDRVNLSYETDVAEIDLQAVRLSDPANEGFAGDEQPVRWRLIGQMSDQAVVGGARVAVAIAGSDEPAIETVSDDDGTFTLEVAAGRYDIYIESARGAVVLRDIDIS